MALHRKLSLKALDGVCRLQFKWDLGKFFRAVGDARALRSQAEWSKMGVPRPNEARSFLQVDLARANSDLARKNLTRTMDRAEVTKVLSQVIENYQRCGLRRMGRSTPSAELLAAVQEAGAENGVETISEQKVVQNPAAAAVVSPPDSRAELRQPAGTGQSPSTAPGVGAQDWTLPVLDDRERSTHFAELETQVQQCRACKDIVDFRHQTVFGTGPLRPKICFMGEAPGADEDRLGEPFVGKAGQLLTRIIKAMKLEREEVYILNALKCRPPQNRTPVPEEISNCRGYVESQLEVLRPEYLVCLGAVAVQSLLQTKQPVGRLRGKFHSYKGARVVVTYHPSYLLRNADAKKFVWDDMKMLMRDMGVEL